MKQMIMNETNGDERNCDEWNEWWWTKRKIMMDETNRDETNNKGWNGTDDERRKRWKTKKERKGSPLLYV